MRSEFRTTPLITVFLCAAAALAQSPWPTVEAERMIVRADDAWTGPSPVGNWMVEFRDWPEWGDVLQVPLLIRESMALECVPAPGGGCRLRAVPDGTGRLEAVDPLKPFWVYRADIETDGGMLALDHTHGFPLAYARSTFRPTGGDEMSGMWSYGDDSGPVTWRRKRARIDRVTFISDIESETSPEGRIARVEKKYDRPYWESRMAGSSQGFRVQVFGANLWGHHVIHFPRDVDMVAGRYTLLGNDDAEPSTADDVIGLELEVLFFGERPGRSKEIPRATPGRKTLVIDDVEILFDLVIHDFPGGETPQAGTLTALRYVTLRDGAYVPASGELTQGDIFYIEASFDAPPAEPEMTVALTWTEGEGAEVRIAPSADPLVFRSGPIRLEAPAKE